MLSESIECGWLRDREPLSESVGCGWLREPLSEILPPLPRLLTDCTLHRRSATVDEVLRFIKAKEAGKRSASRLIDTGQRQLRARTLATAEWSALSTNPKPERAPVCSAAKRDTDGQPPRTFAVLSVPHTILLALPTIHHSAAVCLGKNRHQQADASPELQEGAVFDSLCVVNNINRRRNQRFVALDHHLYDINCQTRG